MRLIDRSFHALDEASALKARAYAIAPWLADSASVDRPRVGGRT